MIQSKNCEIPLFIIVKQYYLNPYPQSLALRSNI